MLVLDL